MESVSLKRIEVDDGELAFTADGRRYLNDFPVATLHKTPYRRRPGR